MCAAGACPGRACALSAYRDLRTVGDVGGRRHTPGMASWREVEREVPDLAARVRATFLVAKHATMATLRVDGAPRISGTEVDFHDDGELRIGSMPGARKARDLQRDPRMAL